MIWLVLPIYTELKILLEIYMRAITLPVAGFGILLLIGGFVGFLKAGSLVSFVAGLVGSFYFGFFALRAGQSISLKTSLTGAVSGASLCAAFFIYRWLRSGAWMPAGLMVFLSLSLIAWLIVKGRLCLSRG